MALTTLQRYATYRPEYPFIGVPIARDIIESLDITTELPEIRRCACSLTTVKACVPGHWSCADCISEYQADYPNGEPNGEPDDDMERFHGWHDARRYQNIPFREDFTVDLHKAHAIARKPECSLGAEVLCAVCWPNVTESLGTDALVERGEASVASILDALAEEKPNGMYRTSTGTWRWS